MADNDKKILELQKKIEKAEDEALKLKKANYITNCILVIDSDKYNLNVLNEKELKMLLIRINVYKLSALDLGLDLNDVKFGVYKLSDWMEDINTKIKVEQNNKYLSDLEEAKKTLESLLSKDKKTEMKLAEIEKLLS